MNETQKPLNVEEAAAWLGLKPSYIYNLVYYGKLTAYRPGGKMLLFKISDLEKYAYGNKIGGRSEQADAILNAAQKKKPRKKARSGGIA
jgi:excisionase family DNA binding protein